MYSVHHDRTRLPEGVGNPWACLFFSLFLSLSPFLFLVTMIVTHPSNQYVLKYLDKQLQGLVTVWICRG